MTSQVKLPLGIRHWPGIPNKNPYTEGFELSLLEDCDNAYRFTAVASVEKIESIFYDFSRFVSDEAFFILEYYPEDSLVSRSSSSNQRPAPTVYYSPYLPTEQIITTITPYLARLIHDGFIGFGLANNRKGLEFFYSEEKILTFFTDNHLRLSNFLYNHEVRHSDHLTLPSEFGHDHLSLLGFPKELMPSDLASLGTGDLDASIFCQDLIDRLDMYQVEEGLSFFLTRKEQETIAQLVEKKLSDHEFADAEFGGLLLDWSDFVNECRYGFDGDLWEYKQGLKIRDAIQLVIECADQDLADKIGTIVSEPDTQFQDILTDRRKRLDTPDELAIRNERFWYQGVVCKQGIDLRRDLIRNGWFNGLS